MSGILGIGGGGDSGFYPFSIEQSLRFNDDDSSYLEKTFTTTGNRRTFTISFWFKRCRTDTAEYLFAGGDDTSNRFHMDINASGTFQIEAKSGGSTQIKMEGGPVLRDVGAWYHFALLVDTTQSTSSNRVRLYVNGDLLTFNSNTYPSQNAELNWNLNDQVRIGRAGWTTSYFDGYMAEFNNVDSPIFTAATTSGSATVTGISSTATLKVGMAVSSSTTSVIPDGTTIASIDSSSQITLSANATATNGSVSLTFSATQDFFGETKSGIWIPKAYTGPYGTNGFRLTFEEDTTVEGFNTVLWNGNAASSKSVQGVGFSPDLVWLKMRSSSGAHFLYDTVRGATKGIMSNLTDQETTFSDGLTAFDTDGFTVGSRSNHNGSGSTNVGWCWDAGTGSASSNSNGTITSSVKANAARGFSIVTYTGNGTNGTVGHGLSAAPTWIIVKNRDDSDNWAVWHTGIPITKFLRLNDDATAATPTNARWNDTAPTSTVFSVGDTSTGDNEVNASGDDYVAYCWTDISGYSKMGSYTGNGSSGQTITTGFKPAWIMIKRTDNGDNNWHIVDNTRNAAGQLNNALFADSNGSEGSGTDNQISISSTGFSLLSGDGRTNNTGHAYIYMAFADTREYAFWTDNSGNENDFQHVNLEHTDVMLDAPTDNKATFNFLNKDLRQTTTLSDGNKTVNFSSGSEGFAGVPLTIFRNEGQAYCEFNIDQVYSLNSTDGMCIFVIDEEQDLSQISSGSLQSRFVGSYCSGGSGDAPAEISSGGADQGGSPTKFRTVNDRVGVYIDYDAGKGFFALNGTVQTVNGTPDIANGTNPHFTFTANSLLTVGAGGVGAGTPGIITLKDDPSDWEYTPPAGYTAFSTAELPDPGIDPNKGETPDEYFNTVTYTGTGASTLAITGVGFQPDWVWAKKRSANDNHAFGDVIRGVQKTLFQTSVQQSSDANGLQSFDSDGFTIGSGSGSGVWGGNSGATYVAWNWKAGGAASTIAADSVSTGVPSVASSVSASPESGFSIVTYTTTGVGDITVGHGLGVAPEFIMAKVFNEDYGWTFFMLPAGVTKALGMANNAAGTSNAWGQTAPTSTVFTAGRPGEENNNFEAGNTVVAYCFAPIEGYSKIGIYEGTGNGTAGKEQFVYTGFRPAFVMIKRIDASAPWTMFDNKRDPDNVVEHILFPNTNDDELSPYDRLDFVSNGFKLRDSGSGVNNDDTIVYFAIAEQPFKYANAR